MAGEIVLFLVRCQEVASCWS